LTAYKSQVVCGHRRRGQQVWVWWGAFYWGWLSYWRVECLGQNGFIAHLTLNCSLSFYRASWVFLVCLATLDARVPR
jgi:hypothetical protein